MVIPGRFYTSVKGYRNGFNGKENDDEIKGNGNSIDYGFRFYDTRLGRFLSVDPLCESFHWWTPYQFAGNTPIQAIDLDGLEILLPRLIPIPIEPVLTIPKAPTIPISLPQGEIILPPIVPNLPNDLTVGQPKSPSLDKAEEFDWSKVDRSKPETWPEPPFSGERKIGEPSRQKPKERGEKSWYDEEGGEWRPHTPDKYHPEGHWDYKPPGENSPWQNIFIKNLPEIFITPSLEPKNFFEKIWDGIKDIFTPAPQKPEDNPNYA